MAADNMIRDLFRSLETSLHERLGMIEDVLRMRFGGSSPTEESGSTDAWDRVRALEEMLASLSDRLAALEMTREDAKEVHVHRVGTTGEEIPVAAAEAKVPQEIWIEPMRDLKIELPAATATAPVVPEVVVAKPIAPAAVAPLNKIVEEVVEEEVVEEEVVEEEVVEEEEVVVEEEVVEEEVVEEEIIEEEEVVEEEVVEEEVVEEEVVEEEAEEEGVAVEQFEYKGKTYFRDEENQVYAASKEDPDQPDDTPIGTWDTARERILFRRV